MRLPPRQIALASTLSLGRSWTASQLASAFGLVPVWYSTEPSASLWIMNNLLTTNWLEERWNLDGVVGGASADLVRFVPDPFAMMSGGTNDTLVLDITYPKGLKGGVQFWPLPYENYPAVPQRAVLTYQVAFDPDFDYILGGKLPGLYGGATTGECTGGDRQFSCFSTRLMWRRQGAGEVYAYIPTYPKLCSQDDVSCPDEYGIEISLGAFGFTPGGWTTVTQLVGMNTPPLANGWLYIYINDTLVVQQAGIVYRSESSVNLTRVLFSTFFGGSTAAWYPKKTQHAYFRGFKVWAGSRPSNTTGPVVEASLHTTDTSEEQDAGAISSVTNNSLGLRARAQPRLMLALLTTLYSILVLFPF